MKILSDNMNVYTKYSKANDKLMYFQGRNYKGNPEDLEAIEKKARNIAREIGYTAEDIGDNISDNIKKIKENTGGFRESLPSWIPFSKKPKPLKVKRNEYIEPPRPPKQKTPIKEESPIVIPPKPIFELPKPEFKLNDTNPAEFVKEKETYIKSIIPHADKDEKIALEVMEQFDNYGTRELLKPLLTSISLLENKTDNVANKYLKLYDKFTKDEPDAEKILTAPLGAIIKEFGEVLSKDSITLLISGFKKAGNHPGDLMDIRGFMIGDKYPHPCMKKFSTEYLDEIDKMAQDAETIVRQRVYKDAE